MVRSLTVGCAPKRTVCSFVLTVWKGGRKSNHFYLNGRNQIRRTHVKTLKILADLKHELFGPLGALGQGGFRRVGLG